MVQDSGNAFRSQQYALGVERQNEDIMAQRAQGARQAQSSMLDQQRFQMEQQQARSQLAMDELRRARLAQDVQMGMSLNDLDMAMIQRNTAKAKLKLIEAQVERQNAETDSTKIQSRRPDVVAYMQSELGENPSFGSGRLSFGPATDEQRKSAKEYLKTHGRGSIGPERRQAQASIELNRLNSVIKDPIFRRMPKEQQKFYTDARDALTSQYGDLLGIGQNGAPATEEPEAEGAPVPQPQGDMIGDSGSPFPQGSIESTVYESEQWQEPAWQDLDINPQTKAALSFGIANMARPLVEFRGIRPDQAHRYVFAAAEQKPSILAAILRAGDYEDEDIRRVVRSRFPSMSDKQLEETMTHLRKSVDATIQSSKRASR